MTRIHSPERTAWLLGLGVAMSLLGDATLYVVLPTHTAEAGIVLAQVGVLLSVNRLIRIFLNGPYGILVERLPRRWVLLPSLMLGAAGTLLYTTGDFWLFVLGRLLWGATWSGLWIGSNAVILDLTTETHRGRLIGRFQMWFYIGLGVGAVTGGVLTDWLGFKTTMLIAALSLLTVALLWWLALPETRAAQPSTPTRTQKPGNTLSFSLPVILAIILIGLSWLIFNGVLASILPRLLEVRIGESLSIGGIVVQIATLTGALVAGNMFVSLLSSPFSGWLSDYTRNRWGLVVGALVVGIIAQSLIVDGGGRVIIAATMLGAVTNSVLQTQVTTLIGDYAGVNRRGRALGIMTTASDIGATAGPLLAYNVLLPVVGLSGIFVLMALLLVAILPPVLWVAWREYTAAVARA